MPGLEGDKFKNLMAGYAFMMGYSGKKLLFMGQEFAQEREWSEERELDWYLLQDPRHKGMQDWVKALLKLYRKNPCLYELDSSWAGFQWINPDDNERSIFSFIRKSKDGKNNLIFIINFTPVARDDYRFGVPVKKNCKLVLHSGDPQFGGDDADRQISYKPVNIASDGMDYSIAYPLPAYGVAVFKY